MVLTKQRFYTAEEYLKLEEQAELRHEYIDGEIREIKGGTTNHNQIAGNIYAYFRRVLRGKNYKTYIENVRLWIEENRVFIYPDIMVIEGNPVYYGKGTTTVVNPCLIIEVLSKSTKNYDQGDKFDFYRSLSSLQEYILVEQDRFHVIQYTKVSAIQWLLTEYELVSDELKLKAVSFSMSLEDIYEGVDFNLLESR